MKPTWLPWCTSGAQVVHKWCTSGAQGFFSTFSTSEFLTSQLFLEGIWSIFQILSKQETNESVMIYPRNSISAMKKPMKPFWRVAWPRTESSLCPEFSTCEIWRNQSRRPFANASTLLLHGLCAERGLKCSKAGGSKRLIFDRSRNQQWQHQFPRYIMVYQWCIMCISKVFKGISQYYRRKFRS